MTTEERELRKQAILQHFIVNTYESTCNYLSSMIAEWGNKKYGIIPNINIKWEANFGNLPIWYDGVIKIYDGNKFTRYRTYPFGCVCALGYIANAMDMVYYINALEEDLNCLSVVIQKDQLFSKREEFRQEITRCALNNITHSWIIDELLFPNSMARVVLPFHEGYAIDERPDCEVTGNVVLTDTHKLFLSSVRQLTV